MLLEGGRKLLEAETLEENDLLELARKLQPQQPVAVPLSESA